MSRKNKGGLIVLITTGSEYSCKVEICKESKIVTLTKYEKPIKSDLAKNLKSFISIKTEEQYQDNKRKTLYKTSKKIMSLVKHNVGQYVRTDGKKYPPIFLTLTFSDNIKDWDFANTEYMKFIKRLNYKVYGKKCADLRYIVVPELQDRGAIHYHILFFNLPYIDKSEVQALWGLGITRIEQERKFQEMNGESLGKYITKYMTKQFYNKDKEGNYKFYYSKDIWEGKKTYFASKNLIKPQVFKITENELNSINFVFDNVSCETKLNTVKMDNDDILFSTESEYKMSVQQLEYLLKILPSFKSSLLKDKFVVNWNGSCRFNKALSLGKTVLNEDFIDDTIHFSYGSITLVEGSF